MIRGGLFQDFVTPFVTPIVTPMLKKQGFLTPFQPPFECLLSTFLNPSSGHFSDPSDTPDHPKTISKNGLKKRDFFVIPFFVLRTSPPSNRQNTLKSRKNKASWAVLTRVCTYPCSDIEKGSPDTWSRPPPDLPSDSLSPPLMKDNKKDRLHWQPGIKAKWK